MPVWSPVYAIGRIEPRFPSVGVEKEFAQIVGRSNAVGIDDGDLLRDTLADPANLHLARNLAWVLVTNDDDALVITPADRQDLADLIEVYSATDDGSIAVVVGATTWRSQRGYQLALPHCEAQQLLSFTLDSFVTSVPRPDGLEADVFEASVRSVFNRVRQRAGNTGLADHNRALNFVALRYPAIYEVAARAGSRSFALSGIDSHATAAADGRRVTTIRLGFRSRTTDWVEQYSCRVDTTEVFPFVVSPLQQIFDSG